MRKVDMRILDGREGDRCRERGRGQCEVVRSGRVSFRD